MVSAALCPAGSGCKDICTQSHFRRTLAHERLSTVLFLEMKLTGWDVAVNSGLTRDHIGKEGNKSFGFRGDGGPSAGANRLWVSEAQARSAVPSGLQDAAGRCRPGGRRVGELTLLLVRSHTAARCGRPRLGPGPRPGRAGAAPPGRAGCSALGARAGLRGRAGGKACAPDCGSHAADKE